MPLKTRTNLIHILRNVLLVRGQDVSSSEAMTLRPSEMQDEILDAFVAMTNERFGRDPSGVMEGTDTLEEIAVAIQRSPQISRPVLRRVMRPVKRPARRVVMIPGLHGCSLGFSRLANFVPDDGEVVAWEHPGLDESGPVPRTIDEIADTIASIEIERGADCPLELLGYCIGGLIAHEVSHRLLDAGFDVSRLLLIDAHTARAMREAGLSRRLQVLGPIELAKARFKGVIEHRLVRIGVSQLKAVFNHVDRRVDVDVSVVRTGGELAFGPLELETWSDVARSVELIRIPDVGHVELFRGRHEHRLERLLAG
ncbi:MAG: hypothetical protein CMJ34_14410 [Phycisphaerae bacterium]|nr:hypothetical protein [Phycisphaerae bacterium]